MWGTNKKKKAIVLKNEQALSVVQIQNILPRIMRLIRSFLRQTQSRRRVDIPNIARCSVFPNKLTRRSRILALNASYKDEALPFQSKPVLYILQRILTFLLKVLSSVLSFITIQLLHTYYKSVIMLISKPQNPKRYVPLTRDTCRNLGQVCDLSLELSQRDESPVPYFYKG